MSEEKIIPTSQPEIRPGVSSKFYIYAEVLKGENHVQVYLHKDGVWRESTYYEEKATGYFDTQTKAQQILQRFT